MNYKISEIDMKYLLDEISSEIYEIAIALQGVATKNHLEKLDQIELGDLLETNYNRLSKTLIAVII